MSEKFIFTIPIRFRDLDAMGHVNNATFLTYFEEGRKEFFVQILKTRSPMDFPFILAQVACRYIRPIELSEQRIREALWISRIGRKSFNFSYELCRDGDPAWIFSTGESVQVFYDYTSGSSREIPETFKQRVEPYFHR